MFTARNKLTEASANSLLRLLRHLSAEAGCCLEYVNTVNNENNTIPNWVDQNVVSEYLIKVFVDIPNISASDSLFSSKSNQYQITAELLEQQMELGPDCSKGEGTCMPCSLPQDHPTGLGPVKTFTARVTTFGKVRE